MANPTENEQLANRTYVAWFRSQLGEPPPQEALGSHSRSGRTFTYIEGWYAIKRANEVFGYDGWEQYVTEVTEVRDAAGNIILVKAVGGIVARCPRINEHGEVEYSWVRREDEGTCVPYSQSPDAIDTALKGAVTDLTKRCLRTFGPTFGLSLYEEASERRREEQAARQQNGGYSNAPRPAPQAPRPSAAPPPTAAPQGEATLYCENEGCSNVIEPWKTPDGNVLSAARLADSRRRKWGLALCAECVKKAKEASGVA